MGRFAVEQQHPAPAEGLGIQRRPGDFADLGEFAGGELVAPRLGTPLGVPEQHQRPVVRPARLVVEVAVAGNGRELAVGRADLGLPLVEVGLRAGLAVQLLYLVALHVEEVAVVRLLVRGREAPEDQDVLVRDLEEAAALETDPVGVFLDL